MHRSILLCLVCVKRGIGAREAPGKSANVLGWHAMRFEELSDARLEKLRAQITDYYETYYSEIRSRLSDHELAIPNAAIPDSLRGNRRIVTELGKDGIVITHWHDGHDSFDFHISPEKSARELVAEQCGGETILEYEPGEDFGTYQLSEPLKLVVDGEVVWTASWMRLDVSSHLSAWEDPDVARDAAREDMAALTGH